MLIFSVTTVRRTASCSILFSILLVFSLAHAQTGQLMPAMPSIGGSPAIRNYSPDEYKAHNQIWAIVQDLRGIMYFANSEGIVQYDGVSWRTIPLENATIGRSLAITEDGRIYAGCYGDFGYLAPDAHQQLHYVSLLPNVESQYRDFTDVWQTLAIGEHIYFITQKYIFRWDGKEMRHWKSSTSFHVGFDVADHSMSGNIR